MNMYFTKESLQNPANAGGLRPEKRYRFMK
jgi:hypothetical protein